MRKWVNRALAFVFVGFIAVMFIVTMQKYARNYAYGFFTSYREDLSAEYTLLDSVRARIGKLKYNATNRLAFKTHFSRLNAGFQYALGKDMLATGTYRLVHLSDGALYNLMGDDYKTGIVNSVIDFSAAHADTPVLFAYPHTMLYSDGLLPDDLAALDNNLEAAEYYLRAFGDAGLVCVDSRNVVRAANLSPESINNRSDFHWKHRTALEMARTVALALNERFGLSFDADALDYARMNDEVYPDLFMGEYSRMIDMKHAVADDVHLLTPNYDTDMICYTERSDSGAQEALFDTVREGSFREAMVYEEKLERNYYGYADDAYFVYGDRQLRFHSVNPSAPEGCVLVFKDSYGAPMASFLSLACRDVYMVDMRYTKLTMDQWVEIANPDAIVFAYSQLLLRSFDNDYGQ